MFFLRQKRVSRATCQKKCDERFPLATENCRKFALIECFDRKQLVFVDVVVTRDDLDGAGMIPHEVLQLGSDISTDSHLVEYLTREYKKSSVDFNSAPVSYFSPQSFANLDDFEKKIMRWESELHCME